MPTAQFRRLAAIAGLALAASASGCAAGEGGWVEVPGGAIPLEVRPVEVDLPPDSPLVFAGGIEVRSDDPRFGGISDFEFDADHEGFTAVSDGGYWAVGRLRRENGRLAGAEITRYEPMRGPDGDRLPRSARDAEAIVRDPAGGFLVAFESGDRVAHYDGPGAPEGEIFRAAGWENMQVNKGIEAMAVGPEGQVYAFKEGAESHPGAPVWRLGRPDAPVAWMQQRWRVYVSATDFGPDGRLYAVERGFYFFQGFIIRISRYEGLPDGGAVMAPEWLLNIEFADWLDNFEGLRVWRDADGATRLTVVSDDNFNPLQRTLFLEFVLRE